MAHQTDQDSILAMEALLRFKRTLSAESSHTSSAGGSSSAMQTNNAVSTSSATTKSKPDHSHTRHPKTAPLTSSSRKTSEDADETSDSSPLVKIRQHDGASVAANQSAASQSNASGQRTASSSLRSPARSNAGLKAGPPPLPEPQAMLANSVGQLSQQRYMVPSGSPFISSQQHALAVSRLANTFALPNVSHQQTHQGPAPFLTTPGVAAAAVAAAAGFPLVSIPANLSHPSAAPIHAQQHSVAGRANALGGMMYPAVPNPLVAHNSQSVSQLSMRMPNAAQVPATVAHEAKQSAPKRELLGSPKSTASGAVPAHVREPSPQIVNAHATAASAQSTSSGSKRRKTVSIPTTNKEKEQLGAQQLIQPAPPADEAHHEEIRTEEVQAALQSKPQRGRKRENLSVMERLELTRTRNREHAKSTRIRKKARYQELLDIEQKYDALRIMEDLNNQRRQCLVNFMAIRSIMLQDLARTSLPSHRAGEDQSNDEDISSKSTSVHDSQHQNIQASETFNRPGVNPLQNNPEGGATEAFQKSVSFAQRAGSEDCSDTPPLKGNHPQPKLEDIIADMRHFSCVPMSVKNKGTEDDRPKKGIKAIRGQDRALLAYAKAHYGEDSLATIQFNLTGSANGIAVTQTNLAFAEFEVTLQESGADGVAALCSGVMKVEFASGSDKFVSVEWLGMQDLVNGTAFSLPDETGHGDNSSDSSDSLGQQKSFPSVVSLDQPPGECAEKKKSRDCSSAKNSKGGNNRLEGGGKQQLMEGESGPGMNI